MDRLERQRSAPIEALTLPPWRRLAPGALFVCYLTATIIMFAFGPILYPVSNPWTLYLFVAAAHLSFLLGNAAAVLRRRRPRPPQAWVRHLTPSTLVILSSVLNILLLVPSTLFMTSGSFDLLTAVADPASAYRRALQVSVATTNPFAYPAMLVAPLTFLTVPLTLFYWRQLGLRTRILAATTLVVIWTCGMMLGRNKAFADLCLLSLVFVLAHVLRGRRLLFSRRLLVGLLISAIMFGAFFALFSLGASGRMGARFEEGFVYSTQRPMDLDNIMLWPVPERLKPGVGQIFNYVTQGYYGLSLALRLDFVWTHGFGNSFFLHLVEERFLGLDYARRNCYPGRLEESFGYPMRFRWHTIYPWLASDMTFAGSLLFVSLVGWLLGVTWMETLVGHNPFSVALFANLCLMLYYFSANNQILAFPVQFSGSVGLLVIYLVSRAGWPGDGVAGLARRFGFVTPG